MHKIKLLFCYGAATSSAEGRVGTVSGTSISFGTAATFLSSQASYIDHSLLIALRINTYLSIQIQTTAITEKYELQLLVVQMLVLELL